MIMKKLIILIVLLAVTGTGYYFYNKEKFHEKQERQILYGNVDIRDVALGFRVSGRIKTLYYEEGDQIRKGNLLAELDKEAFKEDVALYKAELAANKAILHNAQKVYKRREKLVKIGAVSQGAYDDAIAARDEAKARLQIAKVRLQLAHTQLQDTKILSPSNGIVLTRVREQGSIVSQGATVYTLALVDEVWIRTYIDEPNLGNIYPGQKVIVSTDSGDEYEGHIGFISPQAEFTPKNVETTQLRTNLVYRLRVIVNHPNNHLRQGMPVTLKIEKQGREDDKAHSEH